MESEKSWNFEKDEMLIEMVKSRPGLYDLQSPYYSDAHYKKQVWSEIEKAIGQSGAKTRWESLRGQYRKYVSKLKTKSGQSAAKVSKWRFHDQMEFLTQFINVERPRLSSLIVDEENIEAEREEAEREIEEIEPLSSMTAPIQRKKNKTKCNVEEENATTTLMKYLLKQKEDESANIHPMDKFFQLMAATVKNFSPRDQHLVKTEVFNLISGIEEKYLSGSPSPSFSPSTSTHFHQYPYSRYEPHTSHHIQSPSNYNQPPTNNSHPQYHPPYQPTSPPTNNSFSEN